MEKRITRVRMEAEAATLDECRLALDLGFGTIYQALLSGTAASYQVTSEGGVTARVSTIGAAFDPSVVFSREQEMVEEEYGSRRDRDGLSYYGRRVVAFEQPIPGRIEQELAPVMMTGTILSQEDRIRRIELDSRVTGVTTERQSNGVWWIRVGMTGCTCGVAAQYPSVPPEQLEHYYECPGDVVERSAQGGTLDQALAEMEAQLGYENDWNEAFRPSGWTPTDEASLGTPEFQTGAGTTGG